MKPSARTIPLLSLLVSLTALAADWPDFRGPARDGRSAETGLPDQWTKQNQLWQVPFGGRSTPVVLGDRVYVLNSAGKDETLQERLMCLDALTGKTLWEYKSNVYLSDVPPHRIAWSSPAADPATGNVYFYGVGGTLAGFTRDGKKLWERSLGEDVGLVTTHGGRTVSPVVDGDLVIVSGVSTAWGEYARAAHRFMAFDKRTGEIAWISAPGGRPFDTTYSPPVITEINGTRLLIAGGGDGTVHAIKASTGEPVWKYVISKRGVNTGVVVVNQLAFVSHSEENYDTSDMGLLAGVDAAHQGDITPAQVKWALKGFQGGFSSPVSDGKVLYQIDNGSNLFAFDPATGKQLWKQNLGTIQKASPVLADGKIYVGNENGRFFILKPGPDGAQILDKVELAQDRGEEMITASVAISNGRVFVVSTGAIYCFGARKPGPAWRPAPAAAPKRPEGAKPAYLQVRPGEVVLTPGGTQQFTGLLFDGKGNYLRAVQPKWTWPLEGTIDAAGKLTAQGGAQAGLLAAEFEGLKANARVRIMPLNPVSENFDARQPGPPPAHWVNTTGKYEVRALDGNNVLVKLADNAFTKRARSYFGPVHQSNYTIEADVRATERRRQMGDAGVVAQRYQLTLFGNHQRLELQPWQPETHRTAAREFAWKKDTWYRIKLRVENLPGGQTKAQGKAWQADQPEPAGWLIERIDPIGNREGAPGVYADAPFEVFIDNIKVTKNQ